MRVQCPAPEPWSVEHLHGEVSSTDLDTLITVILVTLKCFSFHLTKMRPVLSSSRRGSEDTEAGQQQRLVRIQLTKEPGGGLGLSIGNVILYIL